MSINWYPGHMAKTRRLMIDDLKNVDVVCEIIDARIPHSSRNPDLNRVTIDKKHLLVLNRADQADPKATALWKAYYKNKGYAVIETDSQKGGFLPLFTKAIKELCADLIEKNNKKGLVGKTIKVMIMGIPNVGKSSFINRLLGKKSAAAADKPGVTKNKQWFSLPGGFDFMDTPGMLWPKIEEDEIGYKLAFTGTIKDEILDAEDLACHLLVALEKVACDAVVKRYAITGISEEHPHETLEELGRARGLLVSGGDVDMERTARVLLDDYRAGKLGRSTLEMPPNGGK